MTHTPGEEIVIVFEDLKRKELTPHGLQLMIDKMNQVARDNGFAIEAIGNRKEIRKKFNMDFDDHKSTPIV